MTFRSPLRPALLATVPALLLAVAAPAQPSAFSVSGTDGGAQSPADPVEALGRYLRVLATFPNNLDALTGAGRSALAVGDVNAAIGFFSRAEKIAPRDGRIKAGLASALVQMDQPDTALRLFDEAVALGLPESMIASDRGLARDLVGDTKRAQQDYQLALRNGADDETSRRLATSQAISGDRAAAMATLDPLLRRQDRAAWRVRAFALALTGDSKGAEDAVLQLMPRPQAQAMTPFFSRLATLNPGQKAAAVNLGRLPSNGQDRSNAALFASADLAARPVPTPPARAAAPVNRSSANATALANAREAARLRQQAAIAASMPRSQPAQVYAETVPTRYETSTGTQNGTEGRGFTTRTETVTLTRQDTQPAPPPSTMPARIAGTAPAATSPALAAATAAATVPPAANRMPAEAGSAVAATAGPAVMPAAALTRSPALVAASAATTSSASGVPPVAASPAVAAASPSPVAGAPLRAVDLPASRVGPTAEPVRLAQAEPVRPPVVPAQETPRPAPMRSAPPEEKPAAREPRPAPPAEKAIASERPASRASASAKARPAAEAEDKSAKGKAGATDGTRQAAAKDEKAGTNGARTGKGAASSREAKTSDDDVKTAAKGKDSKVAAKDKGTKTASAKDAVTSAEAKGGKDARDSKTASAKGAKADDKSGEKPASGERYWVQVASGSNKADLGKAWENTKAKAPKQLGSRTPWTTPWKQSNRLMVGPFKDEGEAQQFVNQLGKAGMGAMQVTTRSGAKVEKLSGK